MRTFRFSLAGDFVDRYNHTWAVFLLLFVALVTWILPLTPQFQLQVRIQENEPHAEEIQFSLSQQIPKFKAVCWCPAYFTEPMIEYTHNLCENAFNHVMQGGNMSNTNAMLFNVLFGFSKHPEDFEPIFRPNISRPEKKVPVDNKRTVEELKRQEDYKKVLHFMQKITPFYLFLLAICLKIPHLMWLLLCSLINALNVDKVLASAKKGSRLDHQSRHQLYSELAAAVAERVRASTCKASVLYLLLKIAMCIVAIVQVCILYYSLLPQAREVVSFSQAAENVTSNDNFILKEPLRQNNNGDTFQNEMMYSSKQVFCSFKITNAQQIERQEIQCLFSAVISSEMSRVSTPTVSAPEPSRHFPQAIAMYETLHLILLTYLLFLAVVNFFSLVAWIIRLLIRPCQAYGDPDSNLTLDGHLLLQMAKENVGLEVAAGLLQSGALIESKEKTVSNPSAS
ncbi:pannexin 10 [Plakobranchus ocellatus]|uniref:Pannexin 10 n=1 Tax=Plakobranchus ocellatus TaxID=259542 RepID=A0AAV3Y0J8_9GAST|nr:pannexin 10 [Plakobranchus ocellatus]